MVFKVKIVAVTISKKIYAVMLKSQISIKILITSVYMFIKIIDTNFI